MKTPITTTMEKLLTTPDQRRLAEALDTAPPIPASDYEQCNQCRRSLGLPPIEIQIQKGPIQ